MERGTRLLKDVGDVFFRLTMFRDRLYCTSLPVDCRTPAAFEQFTGFSVYNTQGSHKKKMSLGFELCAETYMKVDDYLQSSLLNHPVWKPLQELLIDLSSAMKKRCEYLQRQATAASERQHSIYVKCLLQNADSWYYRPHFDGMDSKYLRLYRALEAVGEFDVVSQDLLPNEGSSISVQRHRWIKNIRIPIPTIIVRYQIMEGHPNQYYAIRVPRDFDASRHGSCHEVYGAFKRLEQYIDEYFSRQMVQALKDILSSLFLLVLRQKRRRNLNSKRCHSKNYIKEFNKEKTQNHKFEMLSLLNSQFMVIGTL